jgi:alpha/beta hydrolase fold
MGRFHGVRGDRKCGSFPDHLNEVDCHVPRESRSFARDATRRVAVPRTTDWLASTRAVGDVVVVRVDYSLSPEAKFPRALERCAAVVRHLAECCSGVECGSPNGSAAEVAGHYGLPHHGG